MNVGWGAKGKITYGKHFCASHCNWSGAPVPFLQITLHLHAHQTSVRQRKIHSKGHWGARSDSFTQFFIPKKVPKTKNYLYCKTLAQEHETQQGKEPNQTKNETHTILWYNNNNKYSLYRNCKDNIHLPLKKLNMHKSNTNLNIYHSWQSF